MPSPVIKVEKVSKVFDRRIILDNIDMEINAGEIFGIIGASGSGKTTLLNIIIGFIKPETGDVMFRTEHLLDHKESHSFRSVFKYPDELKRIIGMAAQTPSFYTTLSVRENLDYFGTLYGLTKDTLKANTNTLINLMDLQGSEGRPGKNLSGGMQRRLDMACSLIHDPKILILDEPTADLDPLLRNHIWRLVRKINKRGTTIILASHHLSELELLCSRIAILKEGKVLAVGTPNEIKERFSKNEEIHLESFPGNYDKIADIKDKDVLKEIAKIEDKGTKLVIYTSKPEIVLNEIIKKLDQHKETIVDLKVTKPTLDEIFIMITESEKDKQEEQDEEKEEIKKKQSRK
ncbi:TPA: ABC transporter ATP-binding protein [Candidatus Woesearchaeota archaeon]|nr:ABC transporter ATP-binding protein [Candidatus Woesearchaeota archaeon]HIH31515.1 ABC transporter ATP-binding protein [Candidatus Woesearchaeota archaeon]HIH54192.1 ABC transporter ATP-binding protein [Candidatus Woesearchaeota archaeon]HIJ13904.1 ABC transporter ATP-binding protein [Candidatus Woesearchaeota archaeon]